MDYITDLQKEIENLKDFNIKLQWSKDRLDRSDQENQIKIDKAINILENFIFYYSSLEGEILKKELLNILRGDK